MESSTPRGCYRSPPRTPRTSCQVCLDERSPVHPPLQSALPAQSTSQLYNPQTSAIAGTPWLRAPSAQNGLLAGMEPQNVQSSIGLRPVSTHVIAGARPQSQTTEAAGVQTHLSKIVTPTQSPRGTIRRCSGSVTLPAGISKNNSLAFPTEVACHHQFEQSATASTGTTKESLSTSEVGELRQEIDKLRCELAAQRELLEAKWRSALVTSEVCTQDDMSKEIKARREELSSACDTLKAGLWQDVSQVIQTQRDEIKSIIKDVVLSSLAAQRAAHAEEMAETYAVLFAKVEEERVARLQAFNSLSSYLMDCLLHPAPATNTAESSQKFCERQAPGVRSSSQSQDSQCFSFWADRADSGVGMRPSSSDHHHNVGDSHVMKEEHLVDQILASYRNQRRDGNAP